MPRIKREVSDNSNTQSVNSNPGLAEMVDNKQLFLDVKDVTRGDKSFRRLAITLDETSRDYAYFGPGYYAPYENRKGESGHFWNQGWVVSAIGRGLQDLLYTQRYEHPLDVAKKHKNQIFLHKGFSDREIENLEDQEEKVWNPFDLSRGLAHSRQETVVSIGAWLDDTKDDRVFVTWNPDTKQKLSYSLPTVYQIDSTGRKSNRLNRGEIRDRQENEYWREGGYETFPTAVKYFGMDCLLSGLWLIIDIPLETPVHTGMEKWFLRLFDENMKLRRETPEEARKIADGIYASIQDNWRAEYKARKTASTFEGKPLEEQKKVVARTKGSYRLNGEELTVSQMFALGCRLFLKIDGETHPFEYVSSALDLITFSENLAEKVAQFDGKEVEFITGYRNL